MGLAVSKLEVLGMELRTEIPPYPGLRYALKVRRRAPSVNRGCQHKFGPCMHACKSEILSLPITYWRTSLDTIANS